MLVVDDISLIHDQRTVFRNLSFSLVRGSYLPICGPNGSGKTSLLRIIARLKHCQHGKIICNNHNVDDYLEEYERYIAYVPDVPIADSSLTVESSLNFWAALYDSRPCLEAALFTFSLTHHLRTALSQLSLGDRQKVSLARLLLMPEAFIWLLDEPFAHLDVATAEILAEMIATRCERRGIVLFTSAEIPTVQEASSPFRSLRTAPLIITDFQ